MHENFIEEYKKETIESFSSYKKLAERALAQIDDEQFFRQIDAESNSLAMIVKHVGGNLRSRWTDFLTTDGEKPDRDRDTEFVTAEDTRETIIELWETGWQKLIETLESLRPADFSVVVRIRGEGFSVVRAINRSLTHTALHVGQITFLAKHLSGAEWQTLSVPRGKTKEFNEYLAQTGANSHYLDAAAEFIEKK